MKPIQIIGVFYLAALSCLAEQLRFDNHKVYSIKVRNEEQLFTLKELEAVPQMYTFLDVPVAVNSTIQLVVPPVLQQQFNQLTARLKLDHNLDCSNLQSVIDKERPNRTKRASFDWTDYNTLEEIYAWVDNLAQQYSEVLSVEPIGYSYEGRDLRIIKVSYKQGNPGIFVDANIHAREWITSATVTWILNELLTSEDKAVRELAENYDWYIVPVANPDGFVYTHTTNRLWRKTRYPYTTLCHGADPNRNFDFQWNNGGASLNPCSDTYAGAYPESEIEVKTISDYVRSVADKITLYLSIHSRGQYILFPYGYNNAPYPSNYDDLLQIGNRATVDLYKVHQKPYRVGTTADVLYIASGISVDWAHGAAGIPLAYTFELRDQGEFGFILPAEQIIPNAEEILAALIGLVDEARVLGMKFVCILLLVASVAFSAKAEQARFDNYRVYELSIENEEQLNVLQYLEEHPDGYIFWESPVQTNMELSLVVPPHKYADFEEFTTKLGMSPSLKISNFQEVIDNERPNKNKRDGFGWDDYYSTEEIYAWLDAMVQQHSGVLSKTVYGQSFEGRDLVAVRLSHKSGNPGIFIEAHIHAREWISSATATWLLNELLTSSNAAVVDLAQNYDWYFVMIANPDGLEFTRSSNRMWRKTRQPSSILCVGTDGNRNFDYNWRNGGSSTNACSDTFSGPEPFSEPETAHMAAYYGTIADRINVQFSFHSYGQYLLTPFGFTNAPLPSNNADLQQIAAKTAAAIRETHGTVYTYGNSAQVLYTTSGSTNDYFMGAHGTKLAYTFEFRDTGSFGFALPANQIIPNAQETLNGLIAFVAEAKALGYM
ncbi:zinc carboxypeptidase A 1-like [Sabethes cyaneus]|uniref:zinc carboxypeptidase A 1-like n=1 Tax=Sabethes cyaneus TaxID=53552 RepID=UPI00237DC78A|nr:zinc carboxypeptidase A 1-like [Sabethes cyaneus]